MIEISQNMRLRQGHHHPRSAARCLFPERAGSVPHSGWILRDRPPWFLKQTAALVLFCTISGLKWTTKG